MCADTDAQRLQQLYSAPVATLVVPNGTDCSALPFVDLQQRYQRLQQLGINNDVVLFMGSRHPPNVEAAQQMMLMAEQLPQFEFWLMGSVCSHPDFLSVPGNVRLLGMVDEGVRRQVLGTATLALNPMLSGSGTNLKMLDYTASGLNVISTEFGLRGLNFAHSQDLIIADIDGFSHKIGEFLQLPVLQRQRLAENARVTTANHYDWPACARPFVQALARW